LTLNNCWKAFLAFVFVLLGLAMHNAGGGGALGEDILLFLLMPEIQMEIRKPKRYRGFPFRQSTRSLGTVSIHLYPQSTQIVLPSALFFPAS